ncbi:MAG: AAA family ATPase, partial [Bryobacteraceae bacterium]
MKRPASVVFPPFRLDPANQCLWRGSESIELKPKAFAVLSYLAGRPGQLILKEEILEAVWPDTFVGEAVLKVAIAGLRKSLGDSTKPPRFIETLHRRGYRFIAPVEKPEVVQSCPSVELVGREDVLSRLRGCLESARTGARQVVFVSGEPGIGKTAVVDAFLADEACASAIHVARGYCFEHHGAGEAYFPFLEALGRMCVRPDHDRLKAILVRHAPTWLVQMPSLIHPSEKESLQRQVLGASRERMLREMAEALEAFTADSPLVLVLEDLHWSDPSTVDLISCLARRRHPAKLMIVGTFRPVEIILSGHALKSMKQDLQTHSCCEEISLDFLDHAAVSEYVNSRAEGLSMPSDFARLVYQKTDGNPLFMVNVVDYALANRFITKESDAWQF